VTGYEAASHRAIANIPKELKRIADSLAVIADVLKEQTKKGGALDFRRYGDKP
jgi:hypothetical protein